MTTKQGDLSLLNDPIAQQLLTGPYPAHLAYTWTDGTPRVIPIGFTWTGTELVTGTPDNAPKLKALKEGDQVAITYDTYTFPMRVLYIRGIVHLSEYDGVVPEWAEAGERVMGKEAAAGFGGLVGKMLEAGTMKFIRLAVEPTWVGILDFEQRFPSGVEKSLAAMMALGQQ
jgi:hypothetical protein